MTQQTRLYYVDPELLQHCAKVVAIDGNAVQLDTTIFHPQGGGQPSDIGSINDFPLIKVYEDVNSAIWHVLENPPEFKTGDEVRLKIEEEPRKLFARLHSAGHLIAHVAEQEFTGLKAIQGHHFPNEARVEFIYTTAPDMSIFKEQLSTALQKVIASNVKVITTFDDNIRKITFGSYAPTPCGGTHVQSLSEIGAISIRNTKNKDGKIRVGYDVIE